MAPGFWQALIVHAKNKVIISPIAVYKEIAGGQDDLAKWVKENKAILFSEPDDKVIEFYRQIADFSNSHYNDAHWIRDFLDGADPWVIAHSKAHNLIVVTMEGSKGSEDINPKSNKVVGRIKIPNMCWHFKVKSISTYDLIRTLSIRLS